MFIEYLVVGDKYKSKLPDPSPFSNEIKLSKRSYSLGNNLYLLHIKCTEDSLPAAKELSGYNQQILKSLTSNSEKYSILTNEASLLFEKELYPLLAKYETRLRKFIKVTLFSVNEEARNRINQKLYKNKKSALGDIDSYLENADLNEISLFLFSNDELVCEINKLKETDVLKTSLRTNLIDLINNSDKKSIWEEYFSELFNDSSIPDNFNKIRGYRNDVMHFHTMSYECFISAKKVLEDAISDLDKQIKKKIVLECTESNIEKLSANTAYLNAIAKMSASIVEPVTQMLQTIKLFSSSIAPIVESLNITGISQSLQGLLNTAVVPFQINMPNLDIIENNVGFNKGENNDGK